MFTRRLATLLDSCRRMGIANTVVYIVKTKVVARLYTLLPPAPPGEYRRGVLRTREASHPLMFRYGSSDVGVFSQIFILNEYGAIPPLSDVRFIVDCGSNVGYSAAYLLSRFPDAHVIAIEPDVRNLELLTQNLAPYGSRAKVLHSAIWSHEAALTVRAGSAFSEWATVVQESVDKAAADLVATDIGTILRDSGYPKIDILKIDIEGAEEEVFRRNYEPWTNRVRVVVIELHNQRCAAAFYGALGSDEFSFSESGELTIAVAHADQRSSGLG